jgi:3-mercaptopyruvate sulfurtransferase SseA
MRTLLTAAVAMTLTAAVAAAQYKTTPQPPPPPASQTQSSPIQITMPNSSATLQAPMPVSDEDLAKARRISRAEAMKMVKAKKAVYIDVRSKEIYEESHIPGAINIPLSQLPARFKDLPPKKFLITYCA